MEFQGLGAIIQGFNSGLEVTWASKVGNGPQKLQIDIKKAILVHTLLVQVGIRPTF